ncbi:hypothetical protein [Arthrobacter sp. PAMC 25486]|uniref:hypothetical protein n=1 Tax=Arthrobacter sp. PAMC 25486 TaxID=1494608 RepID=UPI00138E3F78|nr:hypothetical protein [Arthrobacter sp. PAMC 25486]
MVAAAGFSNGHGLWVNPFHNGAPAGVFPSNEGLAEMVDGAFFVDDGRFQDGQRFNLGAATDALPENIR